MSGRLAGTSRHRSRKGRRRCDDRVPTRLPEISRRRGKKRDQNMQITVAPQSLTLSQYAAKDWEQSEDRFWEWIWFPFRRRQNRTRNTYFISTKNWRQCWRNVFTSFSRALRLWDKLFGYWNATTVKITRGRERESGTVFEYDHFASKKLHPHSLFFLSQEAVATPDRRMHFIVPYIIVLVHSTTLSGQKRIPRTSLSLACPSLEQDFPARSDFLFPSNKKEACQIRR